MREHGSYQAELKLTNKYAQRFGMDEADQHQQNHMGTFNSRYSGNNYMMHSQQNTYMSHRSGGPGASVTYQAPNFTNQTNHHTITSVGAADNQYGQDSS